MSFDVMVCGRTSHYWLRIFEGAVFKTENPRKTDVFSRT